MKVVICGGGISGLSAAYYASKFLSQMYRKGFQIILLEKSQHVGGWLKTNTEDGNRKSKIKGFKIFSFNNFYWFCFFKIPS